MSKFLLNEYYRWSHWNIIHMVLCLGVIYLAHVVLAEPIIMTITASLMTITFFLIKVKSRLSYAANCVAVGSYAYMLYGIGLYASAVIFGGVLFPLSIAVAAYIYLKNVYVEDHLSRMKSLGFLHDRDFFILFIGFLIYSILGFGILTTLGIGTYPLLDVLHSGFYLLSILLAHRARYEYNIAAILSDMITLALWFTIFISMGYGFSLIVTLLVSFGASRLLLVWWIDKSFR